MQVTWDSQQYERYGSERSRPLIDLLARVPLSRVWRITDLGCGPGSDTPALRTFWPDAEITGFDSSREMIEAAQQKDDGADYRHEDLDAWLARTEETVADGNAAGGAPDEDAPDLVVSNAMLHWVPGHRELLPRIADRVGPGGVFAFQVPGNFEAPSHALLREIADRHGYRGEQLRSQVIGAGDYLQDLTREGWSVDAWETTYMHVLQGENPVWEWISGTGARPVLQGLDPERVPAFVEEYQAALREAYPRRDFGTVLPFRRIFVVAARH